MFVGCLTTGGGRRNESKKAAVAALISTYKDNYNSERIQADTQKARKAIVLEMLKGGMQVTAMGLNVMIGGNDARRWMTEVRRKADGYVVRTYPLRDRRVVYRLERINTDYNLFSGQEAAGHE